jgi:hypothetical protein
VLLQLYIDAKVSTFFEKSAVKTRSQDLQSGGARAEDAVKAITSSSLSRTRAEELDARVDEPDALSGLNKIYSAFQLTKHDKRSTAKS